MPERSAEAGHLLEKLGMVALERGDYAVALDWYRKMLAIAEQLGDRAGMTASYHQLGMVALERGDYAAALDWTHKALALFEQIGDQGGVARSYYYLGRVAQARGDLDAALDWYRKTLAIAEQLGNRAGMATSLSQIGILYTEMGRVADAVLLNLQGLALRLQMQSPDDRIDLHWLSHQRQALGADAFHAIVAEHLDIKSTTNVLALLDAFDRAQEAKMEGSSPAADGPELPSGRA